LGWEKAKKTHGTKLGWIGLGGKGIKPPDNFLKARDDNHMMVWFECDKCIFYKLYGVAVNPDSQRDVLVMATIHRANLDCCPSTGTVCGNKDKLIL
jgi:hypothetical protein